MIDYVAPEWKKDAFNCPQCGAYAQQNWIGICLANYGHTRLDNWDMAICFRCKQPSMWFEKKIVVPAVDISPLPCPDMPKDARIIFEEARSIANSSPRGAAALLRLALQRLCVDLGQEGKNINKDIGDLVKKGLPVGIQQALDAVRVVGNNAVHPGEISLDDSPEIASTLFELINIIVERMISQPKKLSDFYASLPTGALEAIKKRDG